MFAANLIIIAGLLFSPLASTRSECAAQSERNVEVNVGKSAVEKHSKIDVAFLEMVEDSRCPKDVECVWAGNAKINVELSKDGTKRQVELNTGRGEQSAEFEGYEIKLIKLTPEPASNIRIRKDGYVATFSFVKKS